MAMLNRYLILPYSLLSSISSSTGNPKHQYLLLQALGEVLESLQESDQAVASEGLSEGEAQTLVTLTKKLQCLEWQMPQVVVPVSSGVLEVVEVVMLRCTAFALSFSRV